MNLFSGLEKFGIKATDSTDLYADEKAAEKKTKEKENNTICSRNENGSSRNYICAVFMKLMSR